MGNLYITNARVRCKDGTFDLNNQKKDPCIGHGGMECWPHPTKCWNGTIVRELGPRCKQEPCSDCWPTYKSGNCSYKLRGT